MGRDFTERGNIVRANFFHDIGKNNCNAIYLDDCASGTRVVNNICVRAGRGIMIGGGRDNVVENNIFVDCDPAVWVDGRGLGWMKNYFNGEDKTLFDRLKAVNFDRPPYSERYPELARIMKDNPAEPKNNRIAKNIRVGGTWLAVHDGVEKLLDVRNNFDQGDPRFVNPSVNDFRLRPDSPALKLGFEPIAIDKIGVQSDEYARAATQPTQQAQAGQ
jgi:parallel beta-helix repeat protein